MAYEYQTRDNINRDKLGEILMSYATTDEAKAVVIKMNSGLTTPKEYVMALADGLLYGNWPWITYSVIPNLTGDRGEK